MKYLIISFILLGSFTVMAETKLECYENFQSEIEQLDSTIIGTYKNLYDAEDTWLDQYFNPGKYYRGPHNPYKRQVKNLLLNERSRLKNWIDEKERQSLNISRELKYCLQYSVDTCAEKSSPTGLDKSVTNVMRQDYNNNLHTTTDISKTSSRRTAVYNK